MAFDFLERSPGWDFPCLAQSASYLSGKSWEALGPQRPGLPRQLSIVTKIALLREGRYFLWLCFPPSAPPGLQKEKRQEATAQRLGLAVRGLYGDPAVTKGGNEYAVLVITLYTAQFVFQYVISIIKLPKQLLMTRTHVRELAEEGGTGAFFSLITKLPSVRHSFMAGWRIPR